MKPKQKFFLLITLSIVLTVFAGIMLKQSSEASTVVKIGWGLVFTMGALTLVRGFRLYQKLP